jgi:hypothetical protein
MPASPANFGFDSLQRCRRCGGLLPREAFAIRRQGADLGYAQMLCDFCDRAWEVRLVWDRRMGQWLIPPAGVTEHRSARNVERIRRRLRVCGPIAV